MQRVKGDRMRPNDRARLEAITDRLDASTLVRWTYQRDPDNGTVDIVADGTDDFGEVFEDARLLNDADAEFIANARDDIQWLLDLVHATNPDLIP